MTASVAITAHQQPPTVGLEQILRMRSIGLTIDVMDGFPLPQKIDRVRAFRAEPGGLRVWVLGTVDDGAPAVLGGNGEHSFDVVEFQAFVPGASLRVTRGDRSNIVAVA